MKTEKKDFRGCRDTISGLPDALISHILTFLPTKEAASTSILAKRWKPLLAFVPNLEFDDSIYLHPRESKENSKSFMAFVDSVMALQGNTPLKRFHLKCEGVVDEFRMLDWIQKVLKRDVSDFGLFITSSWESMDTTFYVLPSEIFKSKTLVKLKISLGDGFGIYVEGDVSLPKLKILHLDYFKIEASMFNKLLSGCHELEELVLFDLMWDDSRVDLMVEPCFVTVSIPTLKRLTFRRSKVFDEANDSVSLSFDNPNLVYLEYSDTIADKYKQVSFNSLVEASLQLRMTSDQIYSFLDSMDKINVTNLLTGICNVKILYLSDNTLEVLGCCCDTIPVFVNLIELNIKTAPDVGWKSLPALLKNCPSLGTLVFEGLHHKVTNICDDEDGCLCSRYRSGCGVNVVARNCLSSSPVKVLKILKFGEICDDDDEDDYDDNDDDDDDHEDGGSCDEIVDGIEEQIELVKHFLETMPNLEQVILYYDAPNDDDVREVSKQLHKLPKVASANCKIQVILDNPSLSSTLSTKQGTLFEKSLVMDSQP